MNKKVAKYLGIILGLVMLLVIEYYSKYAVNYFFHVVYSLLSMYAIINYPLKKGVVLSALITIGSLIKFIELLLIQPTQGNIAMLVFFFVIQILILVIAIVAKSYWIENDKSRRLYKELLETYKQLEVFSNEIKELTLVETRTKIARDLHDTLGHDMTGLIMQLEMASRFMAQEDTDKSKELLEGAKKTARESLGKVRQIVDTLKKDGAVEWAIQSIYELVNAFAAKTNTKIMCDIRGEKEASIEVGAALYRIVQESLTNAIRHGRATQITIAIEYLENEIIFEISDNGSGCQALIMGNGLKGMKERVETLKGRIDFEYEDQFKIKGQLPNRVKKSI
jgi:signal transduction histidine kinase